MSQVVKKLFRLSMFLPLIPNYISGYLTILLRSVGYRFYTPGVWCDIEGLANKPNQHLFQIFISHTLEHLRQNEL
jgi:hypothetical protein